MKLSGVVVSFAALACLAGGTVAGAEDIAAPQGYEEVLDQYHDFISRGGEEVIVSDGLTGVSEKILGLAPEEALMQIGYAVQDISGDGIPELLIGDMENGSSSSFRGSNVYAVYSQAYGAPQLSFEGWARNRYYMMGKRGRFLHEGSGGAANSLFGTYGISYDGTQLECKDFYFTEPKNGQWDSIVYYHNTSGVPDASVSQEVAMTPSDFLHMQEKLEAQTQHLRLIPFSEYAPSMGQEEAVSGGMVQVEWADEALSRYSDRIEFIADSSEYQVKLLFSTQEGVRNFNILQLTPEMDENGNLTYSYVEIYQSDWLSPEKPLVLGMVFYGDTPGYGISYEDENGHVRRFAVGMSGNDGSLFLSEF